MEGRGERERERKEGVKKNVMSTRGVKGISIVRRRNEIAAGAQMTRCGRE